MRTPAGRTRRLQVIGLVVAVTVAVGVWLTPKILRRMDMQGMKPVTVVSGLDNPWAIAFLPDGRMLVTERPGRMRVVSTSGEMGAPVAGLPPVWANDEGGLMDVVLDPDFDRNQMVYWSFSEPNAAGDGASTGDRERTLRRRPRRRRSGDLQAGGEIGRGHPLRLAPRLCIRWPALCRTRRPRAPRRRPASRFGTRQDPADAPRRHRPARQSVRRHAGRRAADLDARSPQRARARVRGGRHAVGHRTWPARGRRAEHRRQGPQLRMADDHLRHRVQTSAKIGEGFEKAGMEQPVTWWGPTSNAPSGLAILTSERYPGWRGQLFAGTLQGGRAVLRMRVDGGKVVEQQLLATGLLERIREVREGPDGWLYITTKNPDGRVIRLER